MSRGPGAVDLRAIDVEDLASEASIDAQAERDHEPARIIDVTPAGPKWIRSLAEFLGDQEPDDDDSEDWVLRDVIARSAPNLMGAPYKCGKTTTALDQMLAVACGLPWLTSEHCLGRQGRAFGVFLEDSERRLRFKMWELCRGRGIDPRELESYVSITRRPFRLPCEPDERALVAEIRAWKADVVYVDNLTRIMVGDPNSTRDASEFSRSWLRIVEETGAAVVFLHHTAKPGTDGREVRSPIDRLRGSGDFAALARNITIMESLSVGDQRVSAIEVVGNLDIRRPTMAVGYQTGLTTAGRRFARLVDLGDPLELRAEAKAEKAQARTSDVGAKVAHDESIALRIAETSGSVSCASLAAALGMSPATAGRRLVGLVAKGDLNPAPEGTARNTGHTLSERGRASLRGVS